MLYVDNKNGVAKIEELLVELLFAAVVKINGQKAMIAVTFLQKKRRLQSAAKQCKRKQKLHYE